MRLNEQREENTQKYGLHNTQLLSVGFISEEL